jgi:hypothetical protein
MDLENSNKIIVAHTYYQKVNIKIWAQFDKYLISSF